MIYADNAATTALDKTALMAMEPFLMKEYGNASQAYSFARPPRKALLRARETIAGCIGALPDEIYFTSGGTESNNWAIKCAVNDNRKNIITSAIEHHSVLNACAALEGDGTIIEYLGVDRLGVIDVNGLEKALSNEVKLVSIMFANNEIGTIQPVSKLSEIAHAKGALIHTDAVQALGHTAVNASKLGVDLLSASAHKFNGPKGIGFLYIKNGVEIKPLINGGAQEGDLRAGTENVAGIVGMAAALKNNCDEINLNARKLNMLEDIFLETLKQKQIDFMRNGSANRIPGNINISIKNADGEMLMHRMDLKGVCISTGSACDSVNKRISHVIQAIGVPKEYQKGTIRVSFGKYNNEKDAKSTALSLASIFKN